MTQDEELLNEIIQRRGYVVVESRIPRQPGERLKDGISNNLSPLDRRVLETNAKWYCIAATDLADMMEQVLLIRELWPWTLTVPPTAGSHFYRVLSD